MIYVSIGCHLVKLVLGIEEKKRQLKEDVEAFHERLKSMCGHPPLRELLARGVQSAAGVDMDEPDLAQNCLDHISLFAVHDLDAPQVVLVANTVLFGKTIMSSHPTPVKSLLVTQCRRSL